MKINSISAINNNIRNFSNSNINFGIKFYAEDKIEFSEAALKNLEVQKLQERFSEDIENLKNKENNSEITHYKIRIMNGLINGCTNSDGSIDKKAVKFVDKYLFEKQGKIKNAPTLVDKVNLGCNMGYFLEYMKDENGNINHKNIDFISKVIESKRNFKSPFEFSFIPKCKDDNGIVNPKAAKFMLNSIEQATNCVNSQLAHAAEAYMAIGDKAQEVFDYFKKIHSDYSSAFCYLIANAPVLSQCDTFPQKNFDFIKKLYNDERYNWTYNLDELNFLKNETGELPDDVINKALEMAQYDNCTPESFSRLYLLCKDENGDFDETLFDKYKTIYSENPDNSDYIRNGLVFDTLAKFKQRYSFDFSEKFKLFGQIISIEQQLPKIETSSLSIDFKKMEEDVKTLIKGQMQVKEIDEVDRVNFLKNVLFNPEFDELVSKNKEEIKSLDLKQPIKNKDLAYVTNEIFKGIPELQETIGRKQWGAHKYTLDIHTLLVLANVVSNPKYQTLSNSDKMVLKLSALLHDIAKNEAADDPNHPQKSAIIANSIMDRYIKNQDLKKRALNLIKTHEWLKEYSNSDNKDEKAKEIAFQFRKDNDFELAKILTEADISSINDNIQETFLKNLKNIEPIEAYHKFIQSTACSIFSDFPYTKKYKVINLHHIKDNEDMGQYGFEKGRKKKDLQFLVHMIDENKISDELNKTMLLASSSYETAFSLSLITPLFKDTFANRNYGFIMEAANSDVISTYHDNQNSGHKKNSNDIIELISNNMRVDFKEHFLNELNIPLLEDLGIKINDDSFDLYIVPDDLDFNILRMLDDTFDKFKLKFKSNPYNIIKLRFTLMSNDL